ncbi:uncharacterized protein RSE6_04945 [Rhynchosporium secalis]|uniref:Uncharacterized protein n=1 Tax=Rhynchosporium secalis TaxID=38038 RepID=A0A1E1M6K3_RHYSE|nr:uncharacterized protein RSE6_04945 [Rhynchosporium secalis]
MQHSGVGKEESIQTTERLKGYYAIAINQRSSSFISPDPESRKYSPKPFQVCIHSNKHSVPHNIIESGILRAPSQPTRMTRIKYSQSDNFSPIWQTRAMVYKAWRISHTRRNPFCNFKCLQNAIFLQRLLDSEQIDSS